MNERIQQMQLNATATQLFQRAKASKLSADQIANAAKGSVSRATVYRVLKGHSNGRGDTLQHIAEAIDTLTNQTPNPHNTVAN
jgi:transcriptional regulator with XRE-family HTH domain